MLLVNNVEDFRGYWRRRKGKVTILAPSIIWIIEWILFLPAWKCFQSSRYQLDGDFPFFNFASSFSKFWLYGYKESARSWFGGGWRFGSDRDDRPTFYLHTDTRRGTRDCDQLQTAVTQILFEFTHLSTQHPHICSDTTYITPEQHRICLLLRKHEYPNQNLNSMSTRGFYQCLTSSIYHLTTRDKVTVDPPVVN